MIEINGTVSRSWMYAMCLGMRSVEDDMRAKRRDERLSARESTVGLLCVY